MTHTKALLAGAKYRALLLALKASRATLQACIACGEATKRVSSALYQAAVHAQVHADQAKHEAASPDHTVGDEVMAYVLGIGCAIIFAIIVLESLA